MYKKLLSFIIIFTLVFGVASINVYADQDDTLSSWAKLPVKGIKENNLAVQELFQNYKNNINREEFTVLAVKLYEKGSGYSLKTPTSAPFTDIETSTYKDYILKAYNLGIIQGVGSFKFNPKGQVTREQIAAMFYRLMRKMNPDDNYDVENDIEFVDSDQISSWAKTSIIYLYNKDLMKGVGELKIGPKNNATREQAMTLVYRLGVSTNVILETLDYETYVMDETRGNTSSNLSNQGYSVGDGDWIYYTVDGTIFKMKIDGSNIIKVAELNENANINCLNIYGDKIYFVIEPLSGNYRYIGYVDKDGGTIETLSINGDEMNVNEKIVIIDNWLYYSACIDYGDQDTLYKVNLSDLTREVVFSVDLSMPAYIRLSYYDSNKEIVTKQIRTAYTNLPFVVYGDWIYFTVKDYSEGNICRIKTDGTELVRIGTDDAMNLQIKGNWLYYQKPDDDKLYKIRPDGTEKTLVLDEKIEEFNVSNDKIYYLKRNDNYKYDFYKMSHNGTNQEKFAHDIELAYKYDENSMYGSSIYTHAIGYNISVVGDWIFYDGYGGRYQLKTDGILNFKIMKPID